MVLWGHGPGPHGTRSRDANRNRHGGEARRPNGRASAEQGDTAGATSLRVGQKTNNNHSHEKAGYVRGFLWPCTLYNRHHEKGKRRQSTPHGARSTGRHRKVIASTRSRSLSPPHLFLIPPSIYLPNRAPYMKIHTWLSHTGIERRRENRSQPHRPSCIYRGVRWIDSDRHQKGKVERAQSRQSQGGRKGRAR